jgi:putative hydrolase of the HAD superfamily
MKGLLLDLDGTLVDDKAAMRHALDTLVVSRPHLFSHLDMANSYTLWDHISEKHWHAFEAGELSFQNQRRYRLREFLQRELSDDEADELFLLYTKGYEDSVTVLPGVIEFFERTEHVPKAIVTNGLRTQQLLKLQKSNLINRVKAVITSEEVGVRKPHPRMFELAAKSIGIPLTECFLIGDDLTRDIEPAQKLGMRYFHVAQGDPQRTILRALENI